MTVPQNAPCAHAAAGARSYLLRLALRAACRALREFDFRGVGNVFEAVALCSARVTDEAAGLECECVGLARICTVEKNRFDGANEDRAGHDSRNRSGLAIGAGIPIHRIADPEVMEQV